MKITSWHIQLQDVINSHSMSFMWSYVLTLKGVLFQRVHEKYDM
jgi:hypothetical protein